MGVYRILMDLYKVCQPILDWLARKQIVLEPYHGAQTLEGNKLDEVLKIFDSIADGIADDQLWKGIFLMLSLESDEMPVIYSTKL